jgi:tetratricopeptide (TPR) repeat protein
METGDWISVGAALISTFSLSVSFFALRQKSSESERTIRNQLTDAISKLDSVFAEWDKLIYESSDKSSDPYFVSRRSFLNGQKRFLARQAIYLMTHIPDLVTDFEYNRVADAFCSIGDYDQANKYFEKAVEKAEGAYYRSMCIRAYARCLFGQGGIDDGRKRFKEAIELVPLDSDVNRFHTAETYQRWAILEGDAQNWEEARERLKNSSEIYLKVISKRQRDQGLANLGQVETDLSARRQKALGNDSIKS